MFCPSKCPEKYKFSKKEGQKCFVMFKSILSPPTKEGLQLTKLQAGVETVETAFCVILGHHKKSGKNRPLFDWRTSLPRPGVDFNKWAKR